MIKFQIYSHYKLPITTDPLKYGRLLDQTNNKFIIQLTTKNVAIINQYDTENFVRIFRNGDLVIEFKDKIINENSFIRRINDTKFIYENEKLISTQIINVSGIVTIYNLDKITPFISNNKKLIKTTNFNIDYIFDWIDNSKDPLKAFLIWELCIILVLCIIFIVLPELFLNIDNHLMLPSMSVANIIKLRKVSHKHIWHDLVYNVNNKIFSKTLFEKVFFQFWNPIEGEFTNNNHMFILLKIKYCNGEFSSIGKVQRINKSDLSWYMDFIFENIKFKSEYYNETLIESIVISYGFKEGKIQNKEKLVFSGFFQNYKNNNLPISINPMDYGRIIDKLENNTVYILQNDLGQTITFKRFDKYNEVEFFKSGVSVIKFRDVFINEDKFMRIIDNKSFFFKNGKQILFLSEMKTEFISKTNKSKNLSNNFITLDIETYIDGNTLIPYLISFYDGNNSYSYWLGDYKNVEGMILDCLKSILIRKYNGYKIYVHNLAKFDIIFLLKYLVKVGLLHPVIHNGRIISINVTYGKNGEYQVDFKDSYLLLIASLMELCNSFKVINKKSIFPHFFVNKNNLDYVGEVPVFKFFGNKIELDEYNTYKSNFAKNNNWILKNESIKYCEIDCISLYQVIIKFNYMIFDLFSKNIHHYPTLPSLAFGIFRSNFMKEKTIPQLSGKIAKDIRSGYTGGSVEVYIPQSKPGVEIKALDVNALYPAQMHSQKMPVGIPTYFEGDVTIINPNAFGFFYCKIVAPDNIQHPILQTHVKTHGGIRTMAPIGSWEDMLFSEEVNNARKYDYKIEILWGYTFESKYIFEDYVNFLHTLRSTYPKGDAMNYIAKILLNSLYGRFGMDDNFPNINIIHKDYYPDFENKHFDLIIEKIKIDEYWIVFYKNNEINELTENISIHNVSISIAAAITAYARIHMTHFKNNRNINLYYTDTDSIYTDSDIDPTLIDSKLLGKLKLEHKCKKAIFLSPKVYCLLTDSDKFIYKVKGLSHEHENELTFEDFSRLLIKNVLIEKTQTKWFRKLSEGKINLIDELYTLKVNDNKRDLIYNKYNKFIGTKAYKIDKNKDIK